MKEINNTLAIKITSIVGSMYCAYAFALLALLSLPAALSSGSIVIIIAWIAQTFLQLVLLSIIIVGQNLGAKEQQIKLDKILTHMQRQENQILKDLEGSGDRQR